MKYGAGHTFYSFIHLSNNAEPDIGAGHCGKEIVSLSGAARHVAESESAAANHLRLALAPHHLVEFPAGRSLRVDALAEIVIIRVVPIRAPLPNLSDGLVLTASEFRRLLPFRLGGQAIASSGLF